MYYILPLVLKMTVKHYESTYIAEQGLKSISYVQTQIPPAF